MVGEKEIEKRVRVSALPTIGSLLTSVSHNDQGWARLKPGAVNVNSIQVSRVGGSNPVTSATTASEGLCEQAAGVGARAGVIQVWGAGILTS